MKTIPLTQGKFALVSDKDYKRVSQHKWHFNGKHGYALRNKTIAPTVRVTEYMHRFILGVTDTQVQIDHRNGDKLDNRRRNIKAGTVSDNQRNHKKHREGLPLGARHLEVDGKVYFASYIHYNKKTYFLGSYKDLATAGLAYKKAEKLLKRGIEPAKVRAYLKAKLNPPTN